MSANLRHTIRMIVPAGKASPSPPVGPTLGQKGIKAMDFCRDFNEKTKHFIVGTPIIVRMKVNPDKSYMYSISPPSSSYLLKKACGIEKGASQPGHEEAGVISVKHIYEIGKIKETDPAFRGASLKQVCRKIVGTAKSLGIRIVP